MKKLIYIFCAIVVTALVAVRVSALGTEKHQYVFNAARIALDTGFSIDSVIAQTTDDVLSVPIHINSNRGYIAHARLAEFAPGMKIGDGEIISVSDKIDLDTGLYIVRTRNVKNGLQMAEKRMSGIYIPVAAIIGDKVMVCDDGVARVRAITVIGADENNAVVAGLNDGDVVILSHVSDGDKVKC